MYDLKKNITVSFRVSDNFNEKLLKFFVNNPLHIKNKQQFFDYFLSNYENLLNNACKIDNIETEKTTVEETDQDPELPEPENKFTTEKIDKNKTSYINLYLFLSAITIIILVIIIINNN